MKFAIAMIAALMIGGSLVAVQRVSPLVATSDFVGLCKSGVADAIKWGKQYQIRKGQKSHFAEPFLASYVLGEVCSCAETQLAGKVPAEQMPILGEFVGFHLKMQLSQFATTEEKAELQKKLAAFAKRNASVLKKHPNIGRSISGTTRACQRG